MNDRSNEYHGEYTEILSRLAYRTIQLSSYKATLGERPLQDVFQNSGPVEISSKKSLRFPSLFPRYDEEVWFRGYFVPCALKGVIGGVTIYHPFTTQNYPFIFVTEGMVPNHWLEALVWDFIVMETRLLNDLEQSPRVLRALNRIARQEAASARKVSPSAAESTTHKQVF